MRYAFHTRTYIRLISGSLLGIHSISLWLAGVIHVKRHKAISSLAHFTASYWVGAKPMCKQMLTHWQFFQNSKNGAWSQPDTTLTTKLVVFVSQILWSPIAFSQRDHTIFTQALEISWAISTFWVLNHNNDSNWKLAFVLVHISVNEFWQTWRYFVDRFTVFIIPKVNAQLLVMCCIICLIYLPFYLPWLLFDTVDFILIYTDYMYECYGSFSMIIK